MRGAWVWRAKYCGAPMFETYFKVAFCCGLGMSMPMWLALPIDFLTNTTLFNALIYTHGGRLVMLGFGLLGVAWAIWEGEFIDDVTSSHWSRRHRADW